jgi:malonyl-CoA/methylmalonyl-CoA synthetase
MVLAELFDRSLIDRCDAPALEFRGRLWTFGEIEQASNRLASVLADRGLRAGDRLCVYLANSPELIFLYLACSKLGVIFVPINILYRDREIAHILDDAEPRAIVGDLPGAWAADELIAASATVSAIRPKISCDADTPAAIVYTSGTTGASKGAVLSHGNFVANAEGLLKSWRITSADRLLLPLPLFHVHGLGNGIHCWLASGCLLRLLERFDHRTAVAEMMEFKPTLFFGVPTIYVRLLDVAPDAARAIGASMRLFVSGSAPLAPQILEEFRALFGHTILERYGMTETLMIASNPYDGERRAGTVGLPLPGVTLRLENGELYVRGSNVFAGYWKREEATREAFVDGYFRTGDLATCSDDGYYTLVGRKSDLIVSGGFNIYPREIEEFLTEQPEVSEAAVVGVPDRLRGEVPMAYVVALRNGELDPAALEQKCRGALASFKVPRAFIVVDKLPRNAMGKIQKHLLPPNQR